MGLLHVCSSVSVAQIIGPILMLLVMEIFWSFFYAFLVQSEL